MKEKKFVEVYECYSGLIIKVVVDQTGDRLLAEDICQQVFTKYFENMDHIGDDVTKAWLLHCAKNIVVDHFRKQRVRKRLLFSDGTEKLEMAVDKSIEYIVELISNRQLMERILKDLRDTRPNWYEVIEAVCVRQMSFEEAEKHLGLESTVLRARLCRARKYLREEYGAEYRESIS